MESKAVQILEKKLVLLPHQGESVYERQLIHKQLISGTSVFFKILYEYLYNFTEITAYIHR